MFKKWLSALQPLLSYRIQVTGETTKENVDQNLTNFWNPIILISGILNQSFIASENIWKLIPFKIDLNIQDFLSGFWHWKFFHKPQVLSSVFFSWAHYLTHIPYPASSNVSSQELGTIYSYTTQHDEHHRIHNRDLQTREHLFRPGGQIISRRRGHRWGQGHATRHSLDVARAMNDDVIALTVSALDSWVMRLNGKWWMCKLHLCFSVST